MATVSAHTVGRCKAKVGGQVAGCHAQLDLRHRPAESVTQDAGNQFRHGRARLLTCQPPQNRGVVAAHGRHTPRLGQVNDPARQALVGHSGLAHQGPQPQIRSSWPLRHSLPLSTGRGHGQFDIPIGHRPGRAGFTHPLHTSAPAANLPLPAAAVVRCWLCRGRCKRPVWQHNCAKPLVTWRVLPPAAPRRKRNRPTGRAPKVTRLRPELRTPRTSAASTRRAAPRTDQGSIP